VYPIPPRSTTTKSAVRAAGSHLNAWRLCSLARRTSTHRRATVDYACCCDRISALLVVVVVLRQGMLVARGRLILMMDADAATEIEDLNTLEARLWEVTGEDGLGMAVGSRAHLVDTDAVVKRSAFRNFLMRGFHMLVYVLGVRHVGDTQCGFKLFTRRAALGVFRNMHVEGWIFDIEVLLIAARLRVPVVEVPVNWQEIEGSKVDPMLDSVRMAKDLLLIRLNYTLRRWQVAPLHTLETPTPVLELMESDLPASPPTH
jgi:dolichyl-phosphate beta-glucosyltransferase